MFEVKNWNPELEIYTPKLAVEDWITLLQDEKIFSVADLEIAKRFYHHECRGTYAQLVYAYGENYFFYKNNIEKLGKKIAAKTNCPVYQNHYENILLLEREVSKWAKKYEDEHGNKDKKFYKLRDEFAEALALVDLRNIRLYTYEKISEKVDFDSKKCKTKNTNALENLKFVFMDKDKSANGKRQIPIKGYFSRPGYDDCRVYHIIIKSSKYFGECRLAEDVAIKLLSSDLAYQVSSEDLVGIKSLIGKKYTQITDEEYKNLKLQLTC